MVKKRFVFLLQQIICRIMLFVFYVGGVCLVFGVWCLVFGVWCLVFGYTVTNTSRYRSRSL